MDVLEDVAGWVGAEGEGLVTGDGVGGVEGVDGGGQRGTSED